jgi:predicted AAA+ superfamily ATPase
VYVRDCGLVHALLELATWDDVVGHPVAGASWEGLAIETLVAAAAERYTPTFYRTEDGAEVDLVLEHGGGVAVAVEIKRSSAPEVSRGFRLARDVLRPRDSFVVHGGTEEWPMGDGVTAIALPALARRLAER